MTNPNDPAFNDESYMSSTGDHVHDQGYKNLTKREYFAAMAMQGILSSIQHIPFEAGNVMLISCQISDALIAELNKKDECHPAPTQ